MSCYVDEVSYRVAGTFSSAGLSAATVGTSVRLTSGINWLPDGSMRDVSDALSTSGVYFSYDDIGLCVSRKFTGARTTVPESASIVSFWKVFL